MMRFLRAALLAAALLWPVLHGAHAGSIVPQAVTFTSGQQLSNSAGLAGLPASSYQGVVSLWYNQISAYGPFGQPVRYQPGNGPYTVIQVGFNGVLYFMLGGIDSGGVNRSVELSSVNNLPADGAWHHVLIEWDTQAWIATAKLDGNGVPLQLGAGCGSPCPFTMQFSATYPGIWQISDGGLTGGLAELYVDVTPFDYVHNVPWTYFRTSDGYAISLGSQGAYPSTQDGSGTTNSANPQVYLSGGQAAFPINAGRSVLYAAGMNASAGSFTAGYYGSPATAPTDPFDPGLE